MVDWKAVLYQEHLTLSKPRIVNPNVTIAFTTLPMPYAFAWQIFKLWIWAGPVFGYRNPVHDPIRLPFFGPKYLRRVIKRVHPDLIHSLEFQSNGYLTLAAKRKFPPGRFPFWIATNYGSDLYFYRNIPRDNRKLRNLLAQVDYYLCECARDEKIAREMGLRAPAGAVLPNGGGLDLDEVRVMERQIPTSRRRVIAVKGYENWSGRAIMALKALQLCATLLKDYDIIVYKPDVACTKYVASIRRSELRITIQPYTSHQNMLALFGLSRIYLGISLSDGISTSMLEAMAMGAFPIQTCTSCADEWFEDGRGGFIVRPQVEEIAGRLRQALEDDILVDLAAASNWKICEERLDSRKIGQMVRDQYDSILAVSRKSAAGDSRPAGS